MLATETVRVPFNFTLSRQGESRPHWAPPRDPTTDKTLLKRQDLVGLAQEILESAEEGDQTGQENQRSFEMEHTEDKSSKSPQSPTARFTAVNGRDAAPVPANNGVNGNGAARGSEERQRVTPPGQEKLKINTSTNQDWTASTNASERQSYQPPGSYSEEAQHKRKRSLSTDRNSYHSHAMPSASSKQTPVTATTENETPQTAQEYEAEDRYRQHGAANEGSRDGAPEADIWHSRQYSSHVNSDEHLGEVLQRASQNMDSHQQSYGPNSPGDDDRSPQYGRYDDGREMSASSDPKKRKRNFSNRTKTGCMTCRRRKKKCDENRPECEFIFNNYRPILCPNSW